VAEDVAASSPATPSREERAHASAYYLRFSLAHAFLILLGIVAVGALVLILVRPGAAKGPPWSTFKPTGSSGEIERQIATQVSSEYRAATTQRLVGVFPGPLSTTRFLPSGSGQTSVQVPITLIAVQPITYTGKHETTDYTFFNPASTVAYEMCGFGDTQQNCGVADLAGSNPAALLHREALELALYTLKYVPGTNAVLTYLPPPSNPQSPATAVLLSRNDLKANLRLPLVRTLRPQQILLGGGVPNANHVAELTAARVYSSNYQTLPGDGTAALVLSPAGGG
jgi:hypothetical protein